MACVMAYKVAFALLTLAVIPLLFVNLWLGSAAAVGAYTLAARLANKSMDNAQMEAFRRVRPKP